MKKMLFVFLYFFCLSAFPQNSRWQRIGTTPPDRGDIYGNDHYIDKKSLQKKGGYIQVWYLINHFKQRTDSALSSAALFEIDCVERTFRFLATYSNAKRFLQGKTITVDNTTSQWMHSLPGSIFETITDLHCIPSGSKPQ